MNITAKRKIKKKLPLKVRKQIAKDFGFVIGYVNMVLNGTRHNQGILDRALVEAEKIKAKEESDNERAKKL